MRIEHIAIWVRDLEKVRMFYETYFEATSSSKYHNKTKDFQSYFLSFRDGCRLELMHRSDIADGFLNHEQQTFGIIHFAMSVGSRERVDQLTLLLRADGHRVIGEPRITGDGYYESVVLDPEGNIVEITI
ncbi:MAG: VOC family protein [Breznakibacter sp.]